MAILIYNIITIVAVPFLLPIFLYRILFDPRYRDGVRNRLGILPPEIKNGASNSDRYWFHAVSVGEVVAAIPLIKIFRERHPDSKIILSTVTDTGNQTARDQLPEIDHIVYFPFDLIWIVRRTVNIIRPKVFVFFETEIWPNLLIYLKMRGIPSVMVNGRISERSFKRYKLIRLALKKVLASISLFLMQTEKDREKIVALGADPGKVFYTGNMKYDRALNSITGREGHRLTRGDLNIPDGSIVIVAGSTHQGEEEILVDIFKRILADYPDAVMIMAPRHLNRLAKIESLIVSSGIPCLRRSRLLSDPSSFMHEISMSQRDTKENANNPPPPPFNKGGMGGFSSGTNRGSIIILDTIGELSDLYGISTVAFVGGSLVPVGGHNILEPAVHGKPVIFGPYMDNFQEIAGLMTGCGGAVPVLDRDDLYIKMRKLLSSNDSREKMGREALRFVKGNSGATEKNMKFIEKFIN